MQEEMADVQQHVPIAVPNEQSAAHQTESYAVDKVSVWHSFIRDAAKIVLVSAASALVCVPAACSCWEGAGYTTACFHGGSGEGISWHQTHLVSQHLPDMVMTHPSVQPMLAWLAGYCMV